ncbi:DUF4062 domain-containing protein [Dactylosporangium sp. CA-092794]|uniref:DUF4062 domain-containing protein n=1 Tax=Dactylosporangium sp. CA-092794 TaxID=3239929 RepID=UPI003D93FC85
MTRVYLSGTNSGTEAYREAVSDACSRLGMELLPAEAGGDLPAIDASDVVVLVVGHRYGYIPAGESRSVTELEYQWALERNRPLLAFVVDPAHPWPANQIDRGAAGEALEQFVDQLTAQRLVAYFTTPEDLRRKLLAALSRYASPVEPRSVTDDLALAYLGRTDPVATAACELAVAVSLAAFVEPSLARAVRLDALSHLAAETEADLWFSPLVRDRTADGISFEPAAVPALHRRLRSWLEAGGPARDRAERAAATILGREAPDLRLVAERVTWWSLRPGDDTADRIEAELAPVLAALRSGSSGHARWARRTVTTLPGAARSVAAVAELAARASYVLQADIDAVAPPAGAFDEIDLELPTVEVAVRRRRSSLDVGTFAAKRALGIRLPATRPFHVAVTTADRTEVLTFSSGESRTVEVGSGPVELRTLNGDIYHLPATTYILTGIPTAMPVPATSRDLVVVVPGLFGSRLQRQGRVLWGGSGPQIARTLQSLGDLALPADGADDGITPVGVLRDAWLLPGLWSVTGYNRLIDTLGTRDGHNVVEFAWDWRRDMRQAAERLRTEMIEQLEQWRTSEGGPDARLVIVGHGEGGLVAAHFLAHLGGWEFTRLFIPIATPFRGNVRALEQLVNGARPGIGPLRPDLTTFIRSLQPLYQLLPAYPAVDTGDGQPRRLDQVVVPVVDQQRVLDGRRFLDGLDVMTVPSGDSAVLPVVGIGQPTSQIVRRVGERLETGAAKQDGDGVIPRFAALPPDFADDPLAFYVAGRHGALHADPRVIDFIAAAVSARTTVPSGPDRTPSPLSGVIQIADAFGPSEDITGTVQASYGGAAELQVVDLSTGRTVAVLSVVLDDDPTPFALELPRDATPIYRVSLVIQGRSVTDAEFTVLGDLVQPA